MRESVPSPAADAFGDRTAGEDGYAAHIAAAESRLAVLTKHLAALEAETAAIAEFLASARCASPESSESRAVAAPIRLQAPLAGAGSSAPVSRAIAAGVERTASPARMPRAIGFAALALAGIAMLAVFWWTQPKPAPTIAEFSTDRATIDGGASAQLCIKATDAAVVAIAPDVGTLPAKGKHCVPVRPATTTTYTAVATGSGGQEVQDTVTVAVLSTTPRLLQIHAFTATPARIRAGESTRLCYDVSGADLIRIVPKVGTLLRLRACQSVLLSQPRNYSYDLVAWGENGQVAVRRARIDVVPGATPSVRIASPSVASSLPPKAAVAAMTAPEPVATPPNGRLARRAVYQFDATPSIVERGQAASLCVGVGRWAQGNVNDIGTLEPGITRCYRVRPSETTVYRLRVALDKSVAYETVTVAVRTPTHGGPIARSQHKL